MKQTADPSPILQILSEAVSKMTKDIHACIKSMPETDSLLLKSLIDKENKQLEVVIEKYQNVKNQISEQQLSTDLAEFFEIGEKIGKALQSPECLSAIRTSGYSADPAYCAEHCYRTCGYDSLGEKVCWYSCYYHCGKGG